MSTKIIDADPNFSVNSLAQDIAVPYGYCRCDICAQPIPVPQYDDHLMLHRDIIEDLQRNKH